MSRVRVTILTALLIMLTACPAVAAETDVVCLQVNGRVVEPFFDVVPSGNDVLVPLVETGRRLGVIVTWYAAVGAAEFTRPADGVPCRLSVDEATLTVGEEAPIALEPRPVVVNGILFVPSSVLQAGLGCRVAWQFESQTLLVETTWTRSGSGDADDGPPGLILRGRGGPTPGPLRFQLGVTPTPGGHQWSLALNGSTAWKGGSLGWKGGLEGTVENPRAWLESLGLDYRNAQWQVQLGDASLRVPGFFAGTAVRGLIVGIPEVPAVDSASAVTYWSGKTREGSQVQLYVDGLPFASMTATDGRYEFSGIPLAPIGSTGLKLVIIQPDGTEEILTRQVASVPVAQPPGEGQIVACLGVLPGNVWLDAANPLMVVDWQQGALAGLSTRVVFVGTSDGDPDDLTPANRSDLLMIGASWLLSDQISSGIEFMMDRFSLRLPGVDPTLDFGWRWTLAWGAGTIGLQATLQQFGPDFRLPGSIVAQNSVGLTLAGRWRPVSNGSLTFNYTAQQKADAGWPLMPTHQLSVWGHWLPLPSTSLAMGTRIYLDPADESSDSAMVSWSAGYSGRRFALRGDGGVQLFGLMDGLNTGFFINATASLDMTAGSRIGAALSYRGGDDSATDSQGAGVDYALSLGGGHLLGFNARWQGPDLFYSAVGSEVRSLTTGVTWTGRWGTTTGGSAGLSLVTLFGPAGTEVFPALKLALSGRSASSWALSLEATARRGVPGIRVSLNYAGSALPSPAGLLSVPNVMPSTGGSVGGVVFRDDNGNGVRDAGEPGVKGIAVMLGSRLVETGRTGAFIFGGLPAGRYELGVSQVKLPIDYSPSAGPWMVELGDNQHLWQDIALRFWGAVQGRVFVDRDGDGSFGDGDLPLAGVHLLINGEPTGSYTDDDGFYYVEGLAIGTHRLSLDPDTLPPTLTGSVEKPVQVTESQPQGSDCDFVLSAPLAFWQDLALEE